MRAILFLSIYVESNQIVMNIEKLYEDKDLVVINKPAGVLVHSDNKSKEETIVDWLRKNYPSIDSVGDAPDKRPGIVHRLDKDTSGVLLIAKTGEAFRYLKSLFQKRDIEKRYRAIVVGRPKENSGVIDKDISIKHGSIKRTVHEGRLPKKAKTLYEVTEDLGDYSLVDVYPKTGRTHQIRVHLNAIHNPVVGDRVYGGKPARVSGIERQMLHAYSLKFKSPQGKELEVKAPIPEDFEKALEALKSGG